MTNCNEKILDKEVIEEFIKKLAGELKMQIILGPEVVDGVEENPGITAFTIVDFSHISIHTFANDMETFIDIFSCKPYQVDKVIKMCKEYFATDNSEYRQKEVWWGE
jgi:S-adenosylmethionine decarboxylase